MTLQGGGSYSTLVWGWAKLSLLTSFSKFMQSRQVRKVVKFSPLCFSWISFCLKNLPLNRFLWLFPFWLLILTPHCPHEVTVHQEGHIVGTYIRVDTCQWVDTRYAGSCDLEVCSWKCCFAWLSQVSRFRRKICGHYHLLPIQPCMKVLRADVWAICFSADIRKLLLVFLPVKAYTAALHANSYWQDKELQLSIDFKPGNLICLSTCKIFWMQ